MIREIPANRRSVYRRAPKGPTSSRCARLWPEVDRTRYPAQRKLSGRGRLRAPALDALLVPISYVTSTRTVDRRPVVLRVPVHEIQMTMGPPMVKQLAAGCDQWIMLYQNCAIWYLSWGR